jgi:membrane associated rhomboid family serine protease/Zn-finger nucleic acid-binding protein
MPVLRRAITAGYLKRLWATVCEGRGGRGRACPVCGKAMTEASANPDGPGPRLDVCRRCSLVWFDSREYEDLPAVPKTEEEQMPAKAREILAMAEIERIAAQPHGDDFGREVPDEPWKLIPAFFGFPVEQDANPLQRLPWATWLLSALVCAVSFWSFTNEKWFVQQFGLHPSEPWRYGGITFLTSFLLHGGWVHLLGNVYFLLIFGDNVEDCLGRWRFLLLLLVATVAGDLAHLATDARDLPLIGASGGISGVIVFYALKFPRARLGFLVRFRWFHMPAYFALILWGLLQFVDTVEQLAGMSNVSALAHLGGAAIGFAAWLIWKNK